jgi:teichuronic acid exporter
MNFLPLDLMLCDGGAKDMTLRKKMAHGAMWSLLERAANQGISFIVFMFVARLIGPKEYGLANICFVFFSLANLVILGLVDGIISLQINDTRRLSTMFWCIMGVGAALTLASIIGAPGVAALMGEPRLEPLLRWFSLVFLCLSASVVPNKLIYAALDFKIIALRTLTAAVTSGIVGLYLAFQGFGAYAIVAQQITLNFVTNFVVWRNIEWRPSFVFDTSVVGSSLLPGLKMIGADLVAFSEDQIPRLFIGGVLGPIILGYYAFVTRIRYALQDILINPSLAVLYPSLTKIKEDQEEQKLILGDVISLTGFLIFPALGMCGAMAPLYVPLFFGAAWAPAVRVLQIFICGSAALPIFIAMKESLRAHNRVGSYLKVQIPVAGLGLFLTVVLLPRGLEVMATGVVLCSLCSVPVYVLFFKRWLGISLWLSIARLAKPLAAVGVMLGVMHLYRNLPFYPTNSWEQLFSSIALGGVAYLATCFLVQYREMMKMVSFVRKLRSFQGVPSRT